MSDIEKLRDEIGAVGDQLLSPGLRAKLPEDYWFVGYFLKGPHRWSWCLRTLFGGLTRKYEPPTGERITWVIFSRGWFDVLQLIVRLCLFPIVWSVMRGERWLAFLQGIRFDCPLCFNSSTEPLVYCPKCKQVQGALRSRVTELFVHRCCRCGMTGWWIPGQFFRKKVTGLVCRDTLTTEGCTRPMLVSGKQTRHLVLAGTHVRSKHAVLSRLLTAAQAQDPARRWKVHRDSRWCISMMESELAKRELWKSYQVDTTPLETPGKEWTLARTLLLSQPPRRMLHLHNLAHSWIDSEDTLYRMGYPLVVARHWLFVVDLEALLAPHSEHALSPAEVLSRMARVVQKYRRLPPGVSLSNRIGVLLPVANAVTNQGLAAGLPAAFPWTSRQIEQFIKSKAPAFWMLLTTMFPQRNVAYFGGQLSTRDPRDCPQWMIDAFVWTDR